MPGSASLRARCTARLSGGGAVPGACRDVQAAPPRSWWILLVLGAVLALAGCQDAYNANNNFNFNNPNDPTPTSTSGVVIAGISFLGNAGNDEIVFIVNESGTTANMAGWLLVNRSTFNGTPTQATSYTFGTSFTLGAGSFVRVHSLTGTDTGTDLYSGPNWALSQVAELEQPGGGGVSSCTVGSPTC